MSQSTLEAPQGASELEIAASARAVQLAIRASLLRDVTRLWPALDAKRLNETFPGWVRAMTLLVRHYHGQSAAAASSAYRAAREAATSSPAPRSLIHLAPEPDPTWVNRAFGFSGPGMLSKDTARPNTALTVTLGTAARIALEGGRETTLNTVLQDPVALGFYRVTDGAPCAFCAMLASRGVVYKEHSFDLSNGRFKGEGESKVHNDCGCGFAPAFSRDQQLPELSGRALQVYQDATSGVPNKDRLAAFRKAWAEHLAGEGGAKVSRPAAGRSEPHKGSATPDVLRAQIKVLEQNLPNVKTESGRRYHAEQIARLRARLAANS